MDTLIVKLLLIEHSVELGALVNGKSTCSEPIVNS